MTVIEAVAILFEKCLNTVPNELSRTFPQANIMGMTSSAMAGVLLGNKNGSGLADDAEDGLEALPSACALTTAVAASAADAWSVMQ